MSGEPAPVHSTGIGSWPGTDVRDALRIAFAECPDLPYLPELPARGAYAGMIGRGTAFLAELAVDLQPAGWRLTDGSGRDHRLAIGTLRADLDQLEEVAQGYVGPVKLAVAGPWTLAASVERPRGDRVLADHGARRELAQSLAEGVAQLVQELRRRLPEVSWLVQLDEPLLPAVIAGTLSTASGFSRHRAVDVAEVSEAVGVVVERLRVTSGTGTAVHCCAPGAPVELLVGAGAEGVLVDLDLLGRPEWDAIGGVLEAGTWVGLGAVPTGSTLNPDQVARRVLDPVRRLGLDPQRTRLLLTPACGLASAAPQAAVQTLRTLRTAAEIVTEQLAD